MQETLQEEGRRESIKLGLFTRVGAAILAPVYFAMGLGLGAAAATEKMPDFMLIGPGGVISFGVAVGLGYAAIKGSIPDLGGGSAPQENNV